MSKVASIDNLSGPSLKDGGNVLSKLIRDLYNPSVFSERFLGFCKAVKLKPLYKKDSLTEACNSRPVSLLRLFTIKQVLSSIWKSFVYLSIKFLQKTWK